MSWNKLYSPHSLWIAQILHKSVYMFSGRQVKTACFLTWNFLCQLILSNPHPHSPTFHTKYICFIKYVKQSRAHHKWAVSCRLLIAVTRVRSQANPYVIRSGQPGIYCMIFFYVLRFPLSFLCRMYVLFLQTTFFSFPPLFPLLFLPSLIFHIGSGTYFDPVWRPQR